MLVAVAIFLVAYVVIASEKFPRHYVALIGGALLIVFGILNPLEAFHYINWDTIGLLLGMFILVAILIESGFFGWLALTVVRKTNYHPGKVFILLPLLGAAMATVMDSITVMLFLSALTYQLCKLLEIDPIPLIIAEVCAANAGGSATLVGDPPNVILGTALGFSFADFARNTGPISILAAAVSTMLFYLKSRKALTAAQGAMDAEAAREIEELHRSRLQHKVMQVGLVFFGIAVLLLVTHHWMEGWFGVKVTAPEAALIPAVCALGVMFIIDRKNDHIALRGTIRHVDFESLVFFAGLFVLIGGLEKTQFMDKIAQLLGSLAAGNHSAFLMALHWGAGGISAIVDNVPLALGMTYVLKDLALSPAAPALAIMVWSLALGMNMGGSMTPVGASANVVSYAYLEKYHGKVGWWTWIKAAVPPTVAAMAVASSLVILKGLLGWY
ncbi:MAG: SLC13 family permease [Chloroflexi bacterium]|nr:SLC13 family permease [Chloroflexota bacterium]MCL5275345.1 SLC13 family permease [Chloroflexota bacterium]